MATPNQLESVYLKHILLAVGVRDYSAPFRTFFDNWFAFKEGGPFLNGNSRPHWFNAPSPDKHGQALRRAHFVSQDAARTLGGLARERLMKDHAIPVAVLRDMLFDEQPNSIEEIRAFMLKNYCFGVITDEEDRKLSAAGLRSRMPRRWAAADGLFARYEAVGIVAQDQGCRAAPVRATSLQSVVRQPSGNAIRRLLTSTTSTPLCKGRKNG